MPRNDNSEEDFEKSEKISLNMGNALDLQTVWGVNFSYVKHGVSKLIFSTLFIKYNM